MYTRAWILNTVYELIRDTCSEDGRLSCDHVTLHRQICHMSRPH